ncbi:MAG: AAA family ATPase [Oscillospiraceae bacterium]|nr:AAA family ATPase [Oscillospiraceae bacterium]
MKFIMIHGGIAVGKMTVAQELAKITDLKLFHSHMAVEPVIELFGKYDADIITKYRKFIYSEFVKTDNYGIIATAAWGFDGSNDHIIFEYFDIFERAGAEIYCVELHASQEVRLARNESENRLLHKPSMRDTVASRERLLDIDSRRRYESREGEVPFENHMKIDNTNLAPDVVARMIKERFGL